MNTGQIQGWRLALSFLFLAAAIQSTFAQLSQPTITSIHAEGTNVVVITRVPSGIRRVTLESRQRLGASSWEPRAVTRLDGSGGVVSFRLPCSRQLELMRVRSDATEPLPAAFYEGTNTFLGQPASGGSPVDGVFADVRDGTPLPPGGSPPREVTESDIWKIRGQTLYFFNQYRGLQVIDISDPDAAVVRGTLELPAAGEQMYLLGANHVVLLARNGCFYSGDESQVLVVADVGGSPSVVAKLAVPGTIQESRMVGSALYVASQAYRPVPDGANTIWEWVTLVSSFDLSDPSAPVSRNSLSYPGYGNVVVATDRLLFVVTQDPANWWQSMIRSIDITAPDGTMAAYESIRPAGHVADKFKLDYTGNIFTSISEDWHWDGGRRLVTKLETFRLPDPRSVGPAGVVKLGELELGRGERLHATRFDGSRVYVVTFFQIDPLWVVDLSNPSAPRISGSVQVPGWSTFIEPLGERLVALGLESNRVAVSLFDVHDPSSPALLSKVRLGQNYSWSDANSEEKAFGVFPEMGLILVPYSGDTTNGYTSQVQLIDLNPNSLAARGRIQHRFQPRRATVYSDRILSISGFELLSVDATDRDHPLVKHETELAWSVDRLFLAGRFLIELTTATGWGDQAGPSVRVAPAASPNELVGRLSLTNLPVLGASLHEGRLYIAQGPGFSFYPIPLAADATDPAFSAGSASSLLLTVVGLDNLPAVQVLGQVEAKTESFNGGFNLQAVWPKPGVLVWAGGGGNFWWRWDLFGPAIVGGAVPVNGAAIRFWPPFWGGGGGQLLAFDVSNPASPRFASEIDLGANAWWSFSQAFTAEGLVYLSHQTSEFMVDLPSPWQTPVQTNAAVDQTLGIAVANPIRIGTWVQRSYLDVVDYSDPQHPMARKPVNIPGTLNGISQEGAVLYTTGTHWTTNWLTAWNEYLDASAYDGVSAHLIDSLALASAWPHPLLVVETNLFIGFPGDSTATADVPNSLQTWTLSATGKWMKLGSKTLTAAASALASFPGMLASQQTDGMVELFDRSEPGALRLIGEGRPSGCAWFDLNQADGAAGRGLWLPLGIYGVGKIDVAP